MGRAVEIIAGYTTAPGATLTELTMSSGNSATIRNTAADTYAQLIGMWADNQADGIFQVRSPLLHDNVRGIRMGIVASDPQPLLNHLFPQKLHGRDTLTIELSGSAVAGDIETGILLVHYEDLPGIEAKFMAVDEVRNRMKSIVTVENTIAAGVGGGWSGEELLNAESDLLKSGVEYAIIGYHVREECAAVRWRGSDWGNLGIGGPGHNGEKHYTSEYFCHLSEQTGLPLIPVLSADNAGSVLVDVAQDENGTDVLVTTILAELEK